jgi:2-furoyl-CoA dehydrogenase large subunit
VVEGSATVSASPQEVWKILMDPIALAKMIPGCRELDVIGPNAYGAQVVMGVGPVRGRFEAQVRLYDLVEAKSTSIAGELLGPLGTGAGEGEILLEPIDGGTRVTYRYEVNITGKVAAVGGRLLDGAARLLISQFFNGLVRQTGGQSTISLWDRILRKLGIVK